MASAIVSARVVASIIRSPGVPYAQLHQIHHTNFNVGQTLSIFFEGGPIPWRPCYRLSGRGVVAHGSWW